VHRLKLQRLEDEHVQRALEEIPLVGGHDTRSGTQGFPASWTYGIWAQFRRRAQPFDGACAWWTERLNLAPRGGETDPVDAMWVSGDYFRTLGVPALLGRPIASRDDVDGGGRTARSPSSATTSGSVGSTGLRT
jgi:hypothetical protein